MPNKQLSKNKINYNVLGIFRRNLNKQNMVKSTEMEQPNKQMVLKSNFKRPHIKVNKRPSI
jgi:hypothetical protein